jgi:cyclopropane-fatty-acyl-phospholipid synthase
VFQIQLAHRQEAIPLTRNYIEQEEKRLKRLETARMKACNDVAARQNTARKELHTS